VKIQGHFGPFLKVRALSLSIIKEITSIASIGMPVAERWHVRRCRYAPEGESTGRICIATGIHGDEMLGQLIAFGVAQRITAHPEHLHGTVDIYPMLNPLGLDIGERMMPMMNHLDMNRAFPGTPDGTALEAMCHAIFTDMLGADLVLDIHASTKGKSELYEARIDSRSAKTVIPQARALNPDLIWVYADKSAFNATLTAALCAAGTPAMILEADEHRRNPKPVADRIVGSIFCKMTEMGLWSGDAAPMPAACPVMAAVGMTRVMSHISVVTEMQRPAAAMLAFCVPAIVRHGTANTGPGLRQSPVRPMLSEKSVKTSFSSSTYAPSSRRVMRMPS
jgi:predicted deacylase